MFPNIPDPVVELNGGYLVGAAKLNDFLNLDLSAVFFANNSKPYRYLIHPRIYRLEKVIVFRPKERFQSEYGY